ncbi:kelch domain containing protein 9 [Echinococcus multilocularis]|uniref:Kelch domain containing protein 9 n=1 Tax=Echinococcus multilocularis TaxID=6211 RepID=A0A068XVM5_ECHMU|nr:kelch domain containing protein 9 [Echinococcus multilocularis]
MGTDNRVIHDTDVGPAVAYHSGAIIGDYLFIHGGISGASGKSQACINSLYKIQVFPLIGQWTEITTADSPFLSHHQCIPHRSSGCLCFVGGWTGKIRSAGVHIFDTNSGRWLPPALHEPHLKGFPKGSGLSGHSLVPMVTQGNQVAALVIGREGSLHTQRRHDQNVSADLGSNQSFTYTEITSTTASRSYHTTIAFTEHEVLTVGGRATGFVETVTTPSEVVLDVDSGQCKAVAHLIERFTETKSRPITETRLSQIGIRGHYAISGGQGVLVGGGEGFNALRSDPEGEAFICLPFDSNSVFSLGKTKDRRCYAVCAVNSTDGTAWLQGKSQHRVFPRVVNQCLHLSENVYTVPVQSFLPKLLIRKRIENQAMWQEVVLQRPETSEDQRRRNTRTEYALLTHSRAWRLLTNNVLLSFPPLSVVPSNLLGQSPASAITTQSVLYGRQPPINHASRRISMQVRSIPDREQKGVATRAALPDWQLVEDAVWLKTSSSGFIR